MTTDRISPGIREKIYLAGLVFSHNPKTIVPKEDRAEDHERLSDGSNQVDRAIWYAGAPAIPIVRSWALDWDTVSDVDNRLLKTLRAWPGSFVFSYWDYVTEVYVSDGTSTVYYLSGSESGVTVPSPDRPTGYSTKYATIVETGASLAALSVITTGFTMGVAADTRGRQTITLDTPLAALSYLSVTYAAAWRVRVSALTGSYPGQFREGATMELEVV